MNLYAADMRKLGLLVLASLFAWGALRFASLHRLVWRRAFVCLSGLLTLVALWGILKYTVLGRESGGNHLCAWYAYNPGEFLREMFMNALLYVPLGITLTELLGRWSIGVGALLSLGIETWQYVAGTGLAQGTDVLCNVLGCVIGALPYLVTEGLRSKRIDGRGDEVGR